MLVPATQIVTSGPRCLHHVDPGRNASVLGESVDLVGGHRAPEVFYDLSELRFARISANPCSQDCVGLSQFCGVADARLRGHTQPVPGYRVSPRRLDIQEKTLRADVSFESRALCSGVYNRRWPA